MDLMGTDGHRAIRRDREAELGDAFQRRSFHDELLSHGSIPVTLAGTLMSPPPSTGTLHPFGEPS